MRRRSVYKSLLLATFFVCLSFPAVCRGSESGDALAWGRENIAAGKYKDGVELLRKAVAGQLPGTAEHRDAALVLIDALRITGGLKGARDLCAELRKSFPQETGVALVSGELELGTGDYLAAKRTFDEAIEAHPDCERAWALRSFVYRTLGDREGLKKTADHFFALYNAKQQYFNSDDVKDPRELAYVALGCQDEDPVTAFETGYALAEDLAKKRGLRIPEIYLWSARLALDKYFFAGAFERYQKLAKMFPRLPDALVGQAQVIWQTRHDRDSAEKLLAEALDVNPNHIEANLMLAAMDLEEDHPEPAVARIRTALSVNPNNLQALAMMAFYHLDRLQPEKAAEIEKKVLAFCPRCADFYCDIGQLLENKRGFGAAPEWYKKALAVDSDYWRGYYGLGMNLSRQGAPTEAEGKALLLKAFNKNRFNVWAKNMIVALDHVLGDKEQDVPPDYTEFHTKHFTLKCYGKEAAVVRPYLEEWAEAAYASQTAKFHFVPQGPLTIELCHTLQDQAARTVGLPVLGALGVCFGKLCTVVSPREGKGDMLQGPFNWRKVIEHEFGHVMVLQMSEFRVPRWYTEAFSTYLENDTRLQSDQMMKDAIAKGRLKGIDTMNEYFRGNMLMAYVHGRYIIEYIDKTFGFDAHIKAIKLFAQGKTLAEALTAATGADIKTLDAGQLEYVKKSFENVRLRPSYDPASLVQLELAARPAEAPAQAVADFAIAQLAARRFKQAGELAQRALAKDSQCADAFNVLGVLAFEDKDYEGAKQDFIKSTTAAPDHSFEAWRRLGIIYRKEGRTTKAIEAFETARKLYPRYIGPDNPHHELPELYADLEPPQLSKALEVWRDAVKINPDDPEAALSGLRLAMQLKDYKAAAEFAEAHNEIDPYVLEVHRSAGRAYEELKDWPHALREYTVAAALEPADVESFVGLARANKGLGDIPAARKAAEQALNIDGTNVDAKKLRDELSEEK